MKRIKQFLTSPFRLLRPPMMIKPAESPRVKLQKRCVELSRREEDFVRAQVSDVSNPALKELFLCKARGSIFSRPGSINRATYH